MSHPQHMAALSEPAVEVHLLGLVDYEACLALEQRLVYEASGRRDGQISLLVCEHPRQITVGRQGSWGHIRLNQHELASRQLSVRWISRGGGCLLHLPGQLAIYPIVPLTPHGFTVGDYLNRLQAGLMAALAELGCQVQTRPGQYGVWGRCGQVAAFGVAVKHWISYQGVFVNVSPSLELFQYIQTDPQDRAPMSSLAAERHQPIRMAQARESLIRHMNDALGGSRYHIYSGHPLLARSQGSTREPAARAG